MKKEKEKPAKKYKVSGTYRTGVPQRMRPKKCDKCKGKAGGTYDQR
jgi:hypothetical protein